MITTRVKTTMARFAVRQALARRTRLDEMMHSASQKVNDPETIHDLRVAIRRFTQCLRAFAQFFDATRVKRIRKRLRKILKRAGEVRNYDIAIELLVGVNLLEGDLAAELQAKRMDAQKRFADRLCEPKNWRVFESWTASGGEMNGTRRLWNPSRTVQQNARTVLPRLAAELFAAGRRAALQDADYETMHRFRLLGKRFRYTLELFDGVYGEEFARGLEELKMLQDKLGAVNDCVTSVGLLKGHREARAALVKLRKSRSEEFRIYWREHFHPKARAEWRRWLSGARVNIRTPNGNLHTETRRSTVA